MCVFAASAIDRMISTEWCSFKSIEVKYICMIGDFSTEVSRLHLHRNSRWCFIGLRRSTCAAQARNSAGHDALSPTMDGDEIYQRRYGSIYIAVLGLSRMLTKVERNTVSYIYA